MVDPLRNRDSEEEDEVSLGSWRAPLRQFALYSHVGIMFPVAIALGFFAGYALDGWLGSRPWLSLVGLIMGFVAATRNLLRTISIDDDRRRRAK